MTVILAFILVLWAWGRFELFAICTGHGNGSKIDFIFDGNFDVAAYPGMIKKLETRFPKRKLLTGLHNHHYRQQPQTFTNREFCY
jgi:hypothetical protein